MLVKAKGLTRLPFLTETEQWCVTNDNTKRNKLKF